MPILRSVQFNEGHTQKKRSCTKVLPQASSSNHPHSTSAAGELLQDNVWQFSNCMYPRWCLVLCNQLTTYGHALRHRCWRAGAGSARNRSRGVLSEQPGTNDLPPKALSCSCHGRLSGLNCSVTLTELISRPFPGPARLSPNLHLSIEHGHNDQAGYLLVVSKDLPVVEVWLRFCETPGGCSCPGVTTTVTWPRKCGWRRPRNNQEEERQQQLLQQPK